MSKQAVVFDLEHPIIEMIGRDEYIRRCGEQIDLLWEICDDRDLQAQIDAGNTMARQFEWWKLIHERKIALTETGRFQVMAGGNVLVDTKAIVPFIKGRSIVDIDDIENE